jgi:hypothetical protein
LKSESCAQVLPNTHPSARQSGLPWPVSDADLKRFPEAGGAGGVELLEVELAPTEMLYVPPGWFHATEAVGRNLGLSYWSNSLIQSRLGEVRAGLGRTVAVHHRSPTSYQAH